MAVMDAILQVLVQFWRGFETLSFQKRIMVFTVAVASLVSIVALVYFMNRTEYSVLYTNIAPQDASDIIAKIKEDNVPYKLSAGGEAILVPADRVSELKMELAAAGFPRGGAVGFEIFDQKNIGVTDFVQHLNFQRALQGELSRTINTLDEIHFSRVHIVMPKQSLFVEEEKKASASVVLKVKPGRNLSALQIDGIVHLVAGSVEGLDPQDVMVVDSRGNVLSQRRDESSVAKMTSSQIAYQQNVEKELSGRIQRMLERVVGKGSVIATVSAALDFSMIEKTEERYDAEEPAIRSMHKKSEKSGVPSRGKASTVSQARSTGSANENREKTDELVNYELNRTVSKTVMPVGEIKRISVAVLVDGHYRTNDKGTEEFVPRSKKELSGLEEIVKKAVGFKSRRGDEVAMTCLSFRKTDDDTDFTGPGIGQKLLSLIVPIVKYLAVLCGMIVLVLFVLRPVARTIMMKGYERRASSPPLGESGMTAVEETGASPSSVMENIPKMEMDELSVLRQMANHDAKKFAELLRYWMK